MNYYPQQGNMYGGVPNGASPYSSPLGYGGYNGSYFSGAGYNAFNPYVLAQQQEQFRKQQEAALKQQQDLHTKLYNISCGALGVEPQPQVIDRINGKQPVQQVQQIPGLNTMQQFEYNQIVDRENQMLMNQTNVDNLINRLSTDNSYQIQHEQAMRKLAQYQKQRDERIPKDVGLFEYFKYYAADDYLEAQEAEKKRQNQKVNQLYDNNSYNSFLQRFTTNSNVGLDDMTIRLPSLVSEQERQARRKAFLQSLGI